MKGIGKVFVKDLFELISRPYLGIWLIVVPIALLYVASNTNVSDPKIRLLLDNKLSEPKVNNLLLEFSDIQILELKKEWSEADMPIVMGQARAHLALLSHKPLKIFIRPTSSAEMERLQILAYQIAASLTYEKPWQVETLEASWDADRKDLGKIIAVELIGAGSSSVQRNISLIPEIISLIVAFLPFLVSCTAIIRDKENQMLSVQLVAPGINWVDIVLGKALMAMFIAMANLFVLLLFSVMALNVPARTNVWPIVGLQLLAALVSTSIGLMSSTLVKSQLQAYFISAVYAFALIFLTGLFYSIEQANSLVQFVSHFLPLTFSHGPTMDWMLHGLYAWPFKMETLWLAGQTLVGAALVGGSYSVARTRL